MPVVVLGNNSLPTLHENRDQSAQCSRHYSVRKYSFQQIRYRRHYVSVIFTITIFFTIYRATVSMTFFSRFWRTSIMICWSLGIVIKFSNISRRTASQELRLYLRLVRYNILQIPTVSIFPSIRWFLLVTWPHHNIVANSGSCCCCWGSRRHFAQDVGHSGVGPLNYSRCDTNTNTNTKFILTKKYIFVKKLRFVNSVKFTLTHYKTKNQTPTSLQYNTILLIL